MRKIFLLSGILLISGCHFEKPYISPLGVAIQDNALCIPVNGKPGDAPTKGTSPLSLVTRFLIRYRFRVRHRTITWKKLLQGQWAYTTSMGAYVGRWVPWLGAVLTLWDISMITKNVVYRYQLIVGREGSGL